MPNLFSSRFCAGPVLWAGLAISASACAQTTPEQAGPRQGSAPVVPAQPTPNAETPPGGIARGVVPAPHDVDPGMLEKPPVNTQGTMPVIKPPGIAR